MNDEVIMSELLPRPQSSPERPSLLSANLLYLICIVFLLTGGVLLQQAHFGWGLLATEVIIGLLALLWTWLRALPWRETLRLHPTSTRNLALALIMGLGLWLLDTWLGAISGLLFGYDVPAPPGMYPQSMPAAVLLFVALAIGAPLGEELFFRGYMQRAYERLRPRAAILLVAMLFSVFHLSLVGLPPRVPVALALGYVAWRSNSLWPGVLLHAANNAGAVLFLVMIGVRPDFIDGLSGSVWAPGGPLLALAGLLLVVVTLWLFHRTTGVEGAQEFEVQRQMPAGGRRGCLVAGLPLLLASLIFTGVAVLEAVAGLYPELLAMEPLALEPLPWSEENTWSYRVQHPGGETVGNASCELAPLAETASLSCLLHHEPFEVRVGASIWAGGDFTRRFTASYDSADMTLVAIEDVREFENGGFTVTAEEVGERLLLTVTGEAVGESTERIPPTALIDDLWPWQLAA